MGTSLLRRLYTEQMLSRPPHATKPPDGEYAQVITQEDLPWVNIDHEDMKQGGQREKESEREKKRKKKEVKGKLVGKYLKGIACTLFVVIPSHTNNLPSCDADTK